MSTTPVSSPSSGILAYGVGGAIATLAGNLAQSIDTEFSSDIVSAKDNVGNTIEERSVDPKTDVTFTTLVTPTVAETPPTQLSIVSYTPAGGSSGNMTVRKVSKKEKSTGFVELTIMLRQYTAVPLPA